MNARTVARTRALRAATTLGTTTLAVVLSAAPALAGIPVVEQESVRVVLDATGQPHDAQVFSQLTATGKGKVLIEDPTSDQGLRSLDGFTTPTVSDGKAHYTMDVDGRATRRTVADFDKDLPLEVGVSYLLDGKPTPPDKLVGAHGQLEVTYQIKNVSSASTEITYKDGHGNPVTENVDIVTPYAALLTTTLPGTFTNLEAPRADVAGDGRGGLRLLWSMLLFEPIGQTVQEFGWKATIDGGELPAAELQATPVQPKAKPELQGSAEAMQTTAATATQLTGAVSTIDANLEKVQDGAGELLAGLNDLAAGATQLRSGLDGEAAPGARKIADGLGEAHGGADRLAEAFHSSGGKPDLVDGSKSLANGLSRLSAGLDRLAGSNGLGGAYAGALALRAGVDQIVAGLGRASSPDTVLGGLAALAAGNDQLSAGAGALRAGAEDLVDPATGLPAAKGGVDQVKAGLDSALAGGGSIDQLKGGVAAAKATGGCSGDPVCVGTLNAVAAGIDGSSTSLRAKTTAASGGLAQVSAGLQSAIAGIGSGSSPGATTLRGGLDQIAAGLTASGAGLDQVIDGVDQVKKGLKSGSAASPGVAEGLSALADGLTAAVTGVGQLAAGAQTAGAGSKSLANGIATAGNGAQQLASGLGQLQDGAGRLDDGLVAAADGSGQIADGAEAAASGAGQLRDGVGLVRSLGTETLIGAADDSAKDAGKAYATLAALNTRAAQGAMPYGAPTGGVGTAAFVYELAAETSESRNNALRAAVTVLLFAVAAAAGGIVRRTWKPGRRHAQPAA
jgi:putative membrane protein